MTDLTYQRLSPQVLDLVAAHTLYDRSSLIPESHLEGELGIDSIILESILREIAERFGVRLEPHSRPVTLRDLLDLVDSSASAETQQATDTDELLEAVLGATMRHTQYRREQLDLDAELEGELGIDSVVLTSIVADVARELGATEEIPARLSATNLRSLATELLTYAPAPQRRTPAPDANAATLDANLPARSANSSAADANTPDMGASSAARKATDGLPVGQVDHAARAAASGGRWDGRSMKDFMDRRDPDLFAKVRDFSGYLRQREAEHLYWYGMPLQSRCTNRAVIHDELTGRRREFLMFASNNYLGLANHPRVLDAICDATRTYGATNTGCRIIGGTNLLHKELERRLAAFKQRPACIVFPGGYSANLGTISALVGGDDALIVDKLNHMSIVDGGRLARGVRKIYQHNDMKDLQRILERCGPQVMGRLIVTDGVFSMHGDVCDLPEIVRLAKEHGAKVLVDDAHSTGVLGRTGAGTAEHFGLKGEVDLELGTMSKTLAGMGGFVVGEEEVIEYLRFYANSYVFAATIPAGLAAGLIAAIDVMETEPERKTRLWSNIHTLRRDLTQAGFDLENTQSAILPIVVGDERKAMEMGRAVRARGLFCQTVVFPGVPLGDARLRVSVTSEHTEHDLTLAAEIFVAAGRETGVLP